MMRRLVPVLFALASVTVPLAAQSHPDFSGKWVLDPKKVESPMPMPPDLTMTLNVAQDTKSVKIETTASSPMGNQTTTTTVNLDGSPGKTAMASPMGSMEMASTAKWDGDALVVTTKGDMGGQTIQQDDRWTMDTDKKTIRLERSFSAAGQNGSLKFVFNKQ